MIATDKTSDAEYAQAERLSVEFDKDLLEYMNNENKYGTSHAQHTIQKRKGMPYNQEVIDFFVERQENELR